MCFNLCVSRIIDHRWDNALFLREQEARHESDSGAETSSSDEAAAREM
jgi:hypothetical protein